MSRQSLESFVQLIIASESSSVGRLAIIASTPVGTALSYLLAKKLTKGEVTSVFCTWEAVVAYLGLPKSMLAQLADERAYNAMFD